MCQEDEFISNKDLPNRFAEYVTSKINNIVNKPQISHNVYNSTRKLNIQSKNFMSPENMLAALKSIKIKNT